MTSFTASQLISALWKGPFWWLIPFAAILMLMSVFLILAAQYESWSLPLSILLGDLLVRLDGPCRQALTDAGVTSSQVDDVILAVGFWPDPLMGETTPDLETRRWGLVVVDEETGQTIISGMGELHLEVYIERIRREYGVEILVGAPKVSYRESPTKEVSFDYKHKKQSGGSGQFAEVKMVITPTEPGEGYSFESKIVGGAVPKEYIPGVEKGIKSVMDSGPLAGFPVIDFKVALIDGKFHDVDSDEAAERLEHRVGGQYRIGLRHSRDGLDVVRR